MASMQYQPVPYQPFPQQSQGFVPLAPVASSNKDVSPKIVSGRKWFFAKAALEGLSIVTGIVVSGLSGGIIAAQEPYPTVSGYVDAALGFPPGLLSILWPIAELVTLAVRRNRGIHPGAHVGMHLVIWLAGTVAGGLITSDYAIDAEFTYWWFSDFASSTADKTKGYAHYLQIELALSICLWPLVVVNMILFVRACIECHRRNMNRAIDRVNKKAQLMAAQAAWAPAQAAWDPAQAPGQVPYQTMNAYQQYPMVELDKTGTPKPQAPTLSSVTPVQSPFQPPTQPAAAELAPNQLNQQHLIHEIGGAARYPEMATAPARVEMPAAGHQAEMAASTPHPQVATPIQQHIRMEAEPQHIESPDQRPNIPVTETQQVEGDAASVRGQRTGPPQYVMLGGNKVRYYEL